MNCYVSTVTMVSERVTMLRYTYIAYLVFFYNSHLPKQLYKHARSFRTLFTFYDYENSFPAPFLQYIHFHHYSDRMCALLALFLYYFLISNLKST